MDELFPKMMEAMAGNIILAPILVWFMFKYAALVDRMLISMKEMAVVIAKLESAVNNGNGIMVETKGVIVEARSVMAHCKSNLR
jgi:hypothetical protein